MTDHAAAAAAARCAVQQQGIARDQGPKYSTKCITE
jgi:hypothetical protein